MPTSPAPHQLPDRSDFTLTTAAEIGAALPHLLGFHPEQSIICLWLKCRQLVVTQRADTPDDDLAASSEQFTDYVDALFAPCVRWMWTRSSSSMSLANQWSPTAL